MADLLRAYLGDGPVEVEHGGVTFRFPDRSAPPWIRAVCSENLHASVLVLMDPSDLDTLTDQLLSGQATAGDLRRIVARAVSVAGGRPWHEVVKLAATVFATPSGDRLLGSLILRGAAPETLTLAGFCSATWALITENLDSKDLLRTESRLSAPIPGMDLDDMEDDRGFFDMAARLRSMPGARVG
jgi:hypothetical protein